MPNALLVRASESERLRRLVGGLDVSRSIAMRFIAGETVEDGLRAARDLAADGRTVTLDYLGEAVTSEAEARAAQAVVLGLLGRLAQQRLPAGVSVKPTQMGLGAGPGGEPLARELLSGILDVAEANGEHVTLDMESTEVTEATVGLVEALHADGHQAVGCAVQAYLHRTLHDCVRLSEAGASLRLCKGAYAEPPDRAYQSSADVDASWIACADVLLARGTYPRFATHDGRLVDHVRRVAGHLGVERDGFEFQMLYGIRTALQQELVDEGYRLRVYVPFGAEWYPYFMRRLAERPANLVFFLRALVGR